MFAILPANAFATSFPPKMFAGYPLKILATLPLKLFTKTSPNIILPPNLQNVLPSHP